MIYRELWAAEIFDMRRMDDLHKSLQERSESFEEVDPWGAVHLYNFMMRNHQEGNPKYVKTYLRLLKSGLSPAVELSPDPYHLLIHEAPEMSQLYTQISRRITQLDFFPPDDALPPTPKELRELNDLYVEWVRVWYPLAKGFVQQRRDKFFLENVGIIQEVENRKSYISKVSEELPEDPGPVWRQAVYWAWNDAIHLDRYLKDQKLSLLGDPTLSRYLRESKESFDALAKMVEDSKR